MANTWGPQVWMFFHTFAEKISPECFEKNREKCIGFFTGFANLLPCPVCRDHALQNLRKFNLSYITNKDRFIDFFYEFHNVVNKMLNKPVYEKSRLEIYRRYRFEAVWQNFYKVMFANYNNQRNLNESMLRKKLLGDLQIFLINNSNQFNSAA